MNKGQGFTLIEMLTVLALIGLLASWALPGIQGMQQRSQRALAKVALLQSAHGLERVASTQGAYPSVLPASFWQSPGLHYQLTLQSTANGFLLKAIPTGSQSADPCATLTLNQAGERGLEGAQQDVALCWGR